MRIAKADAPLPLIRSPKERKQTLALTLILSLRRGEK
jgi:hypothetical protein